MFRLASSTSHHKKTENLESDTQIDTNLFLEIGS